MCNYEDIGKASEPQLDQAHGKNLATHDVKAVCDGNVGYWSLLKVNVGQREIVRSLPFSSLPSCTMIRFAEVLSSECMLWMS